jgi:6-phosphofructokinase 1
MRCGIPEHKFDVEKMVKLLIEDKRNNPSNYAMVVLSEGTEWQGFTLKEYGEPDAFGHRKKMSVAESFSEEISRLAKQETVISDLTYDLRGGAPDFTDKLVATTFGTMAFDAVLRGKSGLMAAIQGGHYTMASIPDPKLGPRKVDVTTMYDTNRYRPIYNNKEGLPIFLTKA